MKLRKIIAVTLAVLMLVSAMPMWSVASDPVPTIRLTAKGLDTSGNVLVGVSLADNPGIVNMALSISYDASVMTLIDVADSGNLGSALHNPTLTQNPYSLCWVNFTATANITYSGEIAVLTFDIADDAAPGDYTVGVSYDAAKKAIIDVNMNNVTFATENTTVSVAEPAPAEYYVIYFVDGEYHYSEPHTAGDILTAAAEPEKEGYTFSGWSPIPATMPEADVKVYGTFDINEYFFTVRAWNSRRSETLASIIPSVAYEYGTEIGFTMTPPSFKGYSFASSDPIPAKMPAEDVTINYYYDTKQYTINYYVDGVLYDRQSVYYGDTIVPLADAEREGFTFYGWNDDTGAELGGTMPNRNISAYGSFDENSYTVVFRDPDEAGGTVFSSQSVAHGDAATAPADPSRTGYDFTGWDRSYTTITANTTITATYTAHKHTLTVNYIFTDGTAAATSYSSLADYGSLYSITSPTVDGYVADLDVISGTMPDEILTYTVTYYKSVDIDYDGNGNDGGEPPESVNAVEGENITVPGKNTLYKIFSTDTATFYTGGVDVVLVIDSSGSMTVNDRDGQRKQAAKSFISSLGAYDRAAIVEFDNTSQVYSGFTQSKTELTDAINRVDSNGGTRLDAGISSAIDLFTAADYDGSAATLDGDADKVIIFLTDGIDIYGGYSTSYTTTAVSNGITIYTVGLGSNVQADVLKSIADDTGGAYYPISDAGALVDIYDEISERTIYTYYTFKGWDAYSAGATYGDTDGFMGFYEEGDIYTAAEDTTFYARWTNPDDIFYIITWDVDGTLIKKPYEPGEIPVFEGDTGISRAGFICTFFGWDSDGDGVADIADGEAFPAVSGAAEYTAVYGIVPIATVRTAIVAINFVNLGEVSVGTSFAALALPVSVNALTDAGDILTLNVTWDSASYSPDMLGKQIITGTCTLPDGYYLAAGISAMAVVTVKPSEVEILTVTGFENVSIDAGWGTPFHSLGLPATVDASILGGGVVAMPVTWNDGGYSSDVYGAQTIIGTVTVPFGCKLATGLTADVAATVTLKGNLIASVDTIDMGRVPVGCAFLDIGLPSTVAVTTAAGGRFYLPVTWTESDYDAASLGAQSISGSVTLGEGFRLATGATGETSAMVTVDDSVTGQADIVFLVDTTGSMTGEIAAVKDNIKAFAGELDRMGIVLRWALIEYRDITCDGMSSTEVKLCGSENWYLDVDEYKAAIAALRVDGGGDTPETVIDALEMGRLLGLRTGVSRLFIAVTDADFKEDNQYHIDSMDEMISLLSGDGIVTSVVTKKTYYDDYRPLTDGTGGMLANIDGDFYSELMKLASLIDDVINDRVLTGIEITTAPSKTLYTSGEYFDGTGMVVTASYADGSERAVSAYSVSPVRALNVSDSAITVTFRGMTTSQSIAVSAASTPVSGVSLDKASITLAEGKTGVLRASIRPTGATNTGVTWESANLNVAIVEGGVVTAVKAGSTVITVRTDDGGYTAECQVTVTEPPKSVTGVTLSASALVMRVNEVQTLTATVNPSDAAVKTVSWTSSDPSVVSVSGGTVRGISLGTAIITARTADGGYEAYTMIEVTAADPVLERIAVTTKPTKLTYTTGELFAPAGMVVTAFYSDGTSTPVTGYTYTPASSFTVIGQVNVTVSYHTAATSFKVTVRPPVTEGIGISVSGDDEAVIGDDTAVTVTMTNAGEDRGTFGGELIMTYDSLKLTLKSAALTDAPSGSAWDIELIEEPTPGTLHFWFMDDEFETPLTKGSSIAAELIFAVKDDVEDGETASVTAVSYELILCDEDKTTVRGVGNTHTIDLMLDMLRLKDTSGYRLDEATNFLRGVRDRTAVADFLANFTYDKVRVVKADGSVISDGEFVGTGCLVQYVSDGGNVLASCTVVVNGDTTGDGLVSPTDYTQIKRTAKKQFTLTGAYFTAADVTGDGKLSAVDYAYVKMYAKGTYNLYK